MPGPLGPRSPSPWSPASPALFHQHLRWFFLLYTADFLVVVLLTRWLLTRAIVASGYWGIIVGGCWLGLLGLHLLAWRSAGRAGLVIAFAAVPSVLCALALIVSVGRFRPELDWLSYLLAALPAVTALALLARARRADEPDRRSSRVRSALLFLTFALLIAAGIGQRQFREGVEIFPLSDRAALERARQQLWLRNLVVNSPVKREQPTHLIRAGRAADGKTADDTRPGDPYYAWLDRITGISLRRSSALFGDSLPFRCQVLVTRDEREHRALGMEQCEAKSFPPDRLVVKFYAGWLVFHELIHLHEAAARRGPNSPGRLWLSEGVATYYTSFANINKVIVEGERTARSEVPTATLVAQLTGFAGNEESYRLATALVAWLDATRGRKEVIALVTGGESPLTPGLVAAWREWVRGGGLRAHYEANREYFTGLADELLDPAVLAGYRDTALVIAYLDTFPEIEERIIRWNLAVGERGGADRFEYWRDNYVRLARGGRLRDLVAQQCHHPDPGVRAVSRGLVAR